MSDESRKGPSGKIVYSKVNPDERYIPYDPAEALERADGISLLQETKESIMQGFIEKLDAKARSMVDSVKVDGNGLGFNEQQAKDELMLFLTRDAERYSKDLQDAFKLQDEDIFRNEKEMNAAIEARISNALGNGAGVQASYTPGISEADSARFSRASEFYNEAKAGNMSYLDAARDFFEAAKTSGDAFIDEYQNQMQEDVKNFLLNSPFANGVSRDELTAALTAGHVNPEQRAYILNRLLGGEDKDKKCFTFNGTTAHQGKDNALYRAYVILKLFDGGESNGLDYTEKRLEQAIRLRLQYVSKEFYELSAAAGSIAPVSMIQRLNELALGSGSGGIEKISVNVTERGTGQSIVARNLDPQITDRFLKFGNLEKSDLQVPSRTFSKSDKIAEYDITINGANGATATLKFDSSMSIKNLKNRTIKDNGNGTHDVHLYSNSMQTTTNLLNALVNQVHFNDSDMIKLYNLLSVKKEDSTGEYVYKTYKKTRHKHVWNENYYNEAEKTWSEIKEKIAYTLLGEYLAGINFEGHGAALFFNANGKIFSTRAFFALLQNEMSYKNFYFGDTAFMRQTHEVYSTTNLFQENSMFQGEYDPSQGMARSGAYKNNMKIVLQDTKVRINYHILGLEGLL